MSDFRAPLALAAMQIVEGAARFSGDVIFAGRHRLISDVVFEKHLNRLEEVGRPHRFRTIVSKDLRAGFATTVLTNQIIH